jgi:hypothetical protein
VKLDGLTKTSMHVFSHLCKLGENKKHKKGHESKRSAMELEEEWNIAKEKER